MYTKLRHEVERVVTIYMKHDIISMHRQGKSNREISRILQISRNTVARYVNQNKEIMKKIDNETDETKITLLQLELTKKPVRKGVSIKRKFTGDVKRRFYELLEKDKERDKILKTNKQGITGALLHRALIDEGYDIGVTTIQNELKLFRNKIKETFIKQSYNPGDRFEYDFHEILVSINGKVFKKYQATITLPNSNFVFVKHYNNQRFEVFIDSLVSFFEEIGGVPKTMVFDNMRNVVSKFLFNGKKEYNPELIKIANYYGFKIFTTNPYSGNEKGHVEQSGKNVRKELFSLNYEFSSLEKFEQYTKNEMIKYNREIVVEYNNEQLYLLNLPIKRYELGRLMKSIVNHQAFISIDSSFYSVPDIYVGKKVYSNVYIGHLNIFNEKHELIASHKKNTNKGEYRVDITHYVRTFKKKPGALINSLALKQAPKVYQELFQDYFTTEVKKYVELISTKNELELKQILLELKQGAIISSILSDKNNVEKASINQLNEISNLFNQGGNIQWMK